MNSTIHELYALDMSARWMAAYLSANYCACPVEQEAMKSADGSSVADSSAVDPTPSELSKTGDSGSKPRGF